MIKRDDKVLVNADLVPGATVVYGTVTATYTNIDHEVLIVRLDDGSLVKCHENDVTLFQDTESAGETITITKSEFTEAVKKVTDPNFYIERMGEFESMITSLTGLLVCDNLRKELFGETRIND